MSQWRTAVTTEPIAAQVAQVLAGAIFGALMLMQRFGIQLALFEAIDVGIIVAVVAAVLFVLGSVVYMWQARSYSATIKRIKEELRKSSDLQIARIENAYELRLDWMKNDQDALRAQVTLLLDLALRNGSISPAQAVAFQAKPDPEHRLYDNMLPLFDLDDLKQLAFEIGLRWDQLAGDRISVRLIDMINEAKHAGKLAQLEQRAREMRPNMTV
jgi:hypothetical protein